MHDVVDLNVLVVAELFRSLTITLARISTILAMKVVGSRGKGDVEVEINPIEKVIWAYR